jgi:hypothetical protein
MPIRNSRWLPPQVIVLTQDHMGKIEKYVFLWSYCTFNELIIFSYGGIYIFVSTNCMHYDDSEWFNEFDQCVLKTRGSQEPVSFTWLKMAATAGLSLTLDPMEKMFQNASSLKPHGQLKPNCPGKIIWWSKDLPMIDAQFRFNQCNSFREEHISLFSPYGPVLILWPVVAAILDFRSS